MSIPPVFPAAFYRLLAKTAQQLGVSRSSLGMDALRAYAKAQKAQAAPIRKVLPEDLAQQFAEARRKIAQNWWNSLDEKDKKARLKKAHEARWPKKP